MPILGLVAQNVDVVALAIIVIFFPFFILFTLRASRGLKFGLRPIALYEQIRHLTSQGAESGRLVHIGIGSASLGARTTPEALMGLVLFDYVARNASMYGQQVLGTMGDATLLPASQGILQQARREAGSSEQRSPDEVQFYGPDALAYASGTEAAVARKDLVASVLLGGYGAEGLWMAETIGRRDLMRLGGTSDPSAAALLGISCDQTIVGEDLFAAGAYLHRSEHLGSLAAQDLLRVIIILAIIAGVTLASFGYWG